MRVMSGSRESMVATIRQRAQEKQAQGVSPWREQQDAAAIEAMPGSSVGETLHLLQLERQGFSRKKHTYLMAGLGLMGALAVDFTLNPGATSVAHMFLRLGSVVGATGLLVTGGMTGDKVDEAWRKQHTLSYWTQQLRHQQPSDARAEAELVQELNSHPPRSNRQELLQIMTSARDWLKANQESDGAVNALAQVEDDLARVEKGKGDTLDEMRQAIKATQVRQEKIKNACLIGAGVSTLSCLFVPGLQLPGLIGMGGLLLGGIMVQDDDRPAQLRDTLDRWQPQLEDIQETRRLLGKAPEAGEVAAEWDYIDVSGFEVPVSRD
ncbi:MAG: hypothetical protein KC910_00635 [Candidatus Eremiobacteraeota bacterium]|nr:hypothetical protein [Candidatus Eremiobacteraeota bacterium]